MKVSVFTFIRNVELLCYPFIQSIQSVLPIVDEFIINVGEGEDDTLDSLNYSDNIRAYEKTLSDTMRINVLK